ncbi:tpr repeat-containing thioredoxin ttl4 [Olea europaea subsp. europaea]|uniref:Tpr repeat-containing thioredoxin ttl4 n=1 Tax=Olea europaea subsp. europaea TaxID=158383 RepID=A0A8S0S4J6_OLEEU|nr:tpr repeat-containing thioredoxin ttl4 [Olea europaea subsp. europaea]
MSPPMTASFSAFQSPNPDLLNNRDSKSPENVNFFDSLSGAGGYECKNACPGRSNFSGRIKLRMRKMRKKQPGASQNGKSVTSSFNSSNMANSGNSGQLNEATRSNSRGFSELSNGSAKFGNYVGFVFGVNNDINVGKSGGLENAECSDSWSVPRKFCSTGIVFGADKTNSISNLDLHNGNSSFSTNMDNSKSNTSLNDGYFVFGANKNGSTLNTNLESEVSVIGVNTKFGEKQSRVNGGQSGANEFKKSDDLGFMFGAGKNEPERMKKKESNNTDSQSSVNGFGEVNSASFVFRASKSGYASNSLDPKEQDCGRKVGKNESSKDVGKTVPDISDKAQSESRGDSERVGHSSFGFPSTPSVSRTKDHNSFVFGADSNNSKLGADLENNSNGKNGGRCNFTNSTKDSTDGGTGFQNTNINGGFGIGGIRSKKNLNPEGTTLPVDEMNNMNSGKADDSNSFFGHSDNDGTYSKLKFESRCGLGTDFQSPLFELSDEMKGLKIDGSEAVAEKSRNCGSNSSATTSNVFIFGSNGRESVFSTERPDTMSGNPFRDANAEGNDLEKGDEIDATRNAHKVNAHENTGKPSDFFRPNVSDMLFGETKSANSETGAGVSSQQTYSWFSVAGAFGKDNHTMNKKASDEDCLLQNNIQSNRMSSCFFSSIGTAVQPNNGDFYEGINKAEKDSNSFMSTPIKLESSCTDFSTPDIEFSFTSSNLFPGVNKKLEFSANHKSARSRRLKKADGKLRQRSSIRHKPEQDPMSKEGSFRQNYESPGCGSPMDFSPYQDTCSNNAPSGGFATMATGVEGEDVITNGEDFMGHTERPSDGECKFSFSASLPGQDGLSAIRNQYKKKYKLKVGSNRTAQGRTSSIASSSEVQSSPLARNISDVGPGQVQSQATLSCQSKEKFVFDADKQNSKQGPKKSASDDLCEHWRIRGNQAYHAGTFSKAEEFYSTGINCASNASIEGCSIKPLLLCYSNRAATRMSLGRMREALGDCTKAIELDPSFLKVAVRAGNCHLMLGEVGDAMVCYKKCLESLIDVCLDRRVTIEAADGLQKSQRVSKYMLQSAELLQEKTHDAATSALENITEALMISRYSESLFEMKGEALCTLRKYDEVIQLCEQTLDISEKNLASADMDDSNCKSSHVKLWRWRLQSKSHYHLGNLDIALDLIEKQEELISIGTKYRNMNQESSVPFAATVRELLNLKKLGNEAFQSGRHTEAVEHYTAAILKSGESRHFMAICFCNRAAAYQALGQIVDAIADCSVAIALDDNYQKAVSRRATLHEMIRDYKQAVCDLQRVVSLLESPFQAKTRQSGGQDKSNCGSAKDLRRTRRRLSLIEEKARTETQLDLYVILGIKSSDTESEIKKAYRKAALRHHPDKAGQLLARSEGLDDGRLWKEVGENIHKDADRLFKIIGEAYAVLSDPIKRSKYNDEEEVRNYYRDSNSERPSTSYSSPYEKGSRYGRQSGFYNSSSERSNSRRYGNESWKSYGNSSPRW